MKQFKEILPLYAWSVAVVVVSMAWPAARVVAQTGSDIQANKSKEVMWLVRPVVKPKDAPFFFRCGNEPEKDYPRHAGIVINEDGDILEWAPVPVRGYNLSRSQVLLTSYPNYQSIPVRTVIQNSGAVTFESDMVPTPMGNGWIRCTSGWQPAPRIEPKRTRLTPDGKIELEKKFYLNNKLELIEDIESNLGLDLQGHSLIGFIEPCGIPVVEKHRKNGQRIILENGELSEHVFNRIDFYRHSLNHPAFVYASERSRSWVYDPANDKKLMRLNHSSAKVASVEVQVVREGRGLGASIVTDSEFNEIVALPSDWHPRFVTTNNIALCSNFLRDEYGEGHWYHVAFQVVLEPDLDDADRLVEIDVSWIEELELRFFGPLYSARNHDQELVIMDAALEPLMTLGSSFELCNITESGRVLVLNTDTNIYSLFDAEGQLIREFNVAALLVEKLQEAD